MSLAAANASHAPTLLLTPHGHLLLAADADAPVLAAGLQRPLTDAFTPGAGHGLLYLGATQVASPLPPGKMPRKPLAQPIGRTILAK